ncbi:MAG TPA: hypothetical protein VMU50_05040 [Polyangia bacterium]|nr:hypothetical protein [Polyangia bacterium]
MTNDAAAIDVRTLCRRGVRTLIAGAVWALAAVGCAHIDYIPGTSVLKTEQNQQIIDTIEQYRQRLLARKVEELLVLASDKYFEDSGTPRSDDDYGYQGLRQVLSKKLQRVKSIRYDIEYRNIKVNGDRATVEVFIDGSFELAADSGDRYRRVDDYHKFELERDKTTEHWKFLSGM